MDTIALATPATPAGMEYHKIQTLFKRDPESKHRFVIDGDFARDEFAYLKEVEWHVEEKVDGMNTRVHYEPNPEGAAVLIGGKTDNADIPEHLDRAIQLLLPPEKFAVVFPEREERHALRRGLWAEDSVRWTLRRRPQIPRAARSSCSMSRFKPKARRAECSPGFSLAMMCMT